MLYVIDAPAIVTVPLQVVDASRVFLSLNDQLDKDRLCFCDEVIPELERTARNEEPLVWAKGATARRWHKGAAYNYVEWVAHEFKAIVDETARDTQEPAALYVVAQALELHHGGIEVTVVSEDRQQKPTRASVLEACEFFGIPCIELVEYLEALGLLASDDDEILEELDWGEGDDED